MISEAYIMTKVLETIQAVVLLRSQPMELNFNSG
jgi:hypothetical protein